MVSWLVNNSCELLLFIFGLLNIPINLMSSEGWKLLSISSITIKNGSSSELNATRSTPAKSKIFLFPDDSLYSRFIDNSLLLLS